jgi:hypothetical protein
MTPKQALAKYNEQNPTKAIAFSEGRGRLSRDAVAKCTELAGQGWSIAGYVVTESNKSVVSPGQPTVTPVVKKVAPANEKIVQDFTILYDEKAYTAVDNMGKKWSMRNVCNNCRVSMVQCHCGHPTIFGDIAVTIKSSG